MTSSTPHDLAAEAAQQIHDITGIDRHDIALTLGSGWGKSADLLGETTHIIEAAQIAGFRASAVPGHHGTVRSVLLPTGRRALIIGARTHLYEGHGADAVVHSVRVAAACGAHTMVLTNGAGGINPAWEPGTPVLIKDHINLTAATPLTGATFIDMTDVYTPALRELAREIDPTLDEGVYVQFRGPQYETPAEVRMAQAIGGDIAGMSTALEAIAAREAGMQVLGMSLITNQAAGISASPLSHQEVIEAGAAAESRLADLLSRIAVRIEPSQE